MGCCNPLRVVGAVRMRLNGSEVRSTGDKWRPLRPGRRQTKSHPMPDSAPRYHDGLRCRTGAALLQCRDHVPDREIVLLSGELWSRWNRQRCGCCP